MDTRFSISSVLSGTFSTIGRHPLATLGLAFLIGVLPTQLFTFAFVGYATTSMVELFSSTGGVALYIGMIAFSIFCSILVQAVLIRIAVAHAREEKVSIGASLASALAKILPLLGLTILMILGLGVGTLLLLVPGIILYLMWCVTGPALVAEDLGVFEAFSRSVALTKGNRWKLFGLFAILVVLVWITFIILGVLLVILGITGQMADAAVTGVIPIAYIVFNAVVTTLVTAVWGVLVARLYLELRTAKEGPMTDALADVFA